MGLNFRLALLVWTLVLVLANIPSAEAWSPQGKSGICGYWNNHCQGGGDSSSPPSDWDIWLRSPAPSTTPSTPSGPSPAQVLREMRAIEAIEVNGQGNKYFEQGNYDAAIAEYQRALKLNPRDKQIAKNLKKAQMFRENELGLKYYRQGDYDKAIPYFEKALRFQQHERVRQNLLDAKSARENQLGLEYDKQDNLDAAIAQYEKALKINPDDKAAANNLKSAREDRDYNKRQVYYKETSQKIDAMMDDLLGALNQNSKTSAPPVSATNAGLPSGRMASAPMGPEAVPIDDVSAAVDPSKIQQRPHPEKGLKIKDVPPPQEVIPKNDPYYATSRADIILDAVQHGNKNWNKSVEYLENYLATQNPDNPKVREALGYVEGMRDFAMIVGDAEALGEDAKTQARNDSRWLLEAVSGKGTRRWPGDENPDPGTVPPNPLDPRTQRRDLVIEAVTAGKGDGQASLDYLEKRIQANPDDVPAREAHAYLNGFYGRLNFEQTHNREQ